MQRDGKGNVLINAMDAVFILENFLFKKEALQKQDFLKTLRLSLII
jgi:hypothetical protein